MFLSLQLMQDVVRVLSWLLKSYIKSIFFSDFKGHSSDCKVNLPLQAEQPSSHRAR